MNYDDTMTQAGPRTMMEFMRVIFLRKGIFLLSVVMVMAAAYLGLQLKTPLYEAQVTMLIQARKHITSPYYEDIREEDNLALTATQSEIVKSNPVIERVVRRLRLTEIAQDYQRQFASPLKVFLLDVTSTLSGLIRLPGRAAYSDAIRFREAVADLKERIRVAPVRDTNLFTITVADYSPLMAVRIANMVSRSYTIFDLEQQLSEMKQKYGEKHLFVKQLKDNIEAIERETTIAEISHIEAIGPGSVKVIEQATVPIKPQGLSGALVMAVAFLLSLVAGCVFAFFADSHDPTFRCPEDVSSSLPADFLGFIPRQFCVSVGLLCLMRSIMRIAILFVASCLIIEAIGAWAGVSPANEVLVCARFFTDRLVELFLNTPSSGIQSRVYNGILLAFIAVGMVLVKVATWEIKRARRSQSLLRNAHKDSSLGKAYSEVSEEIFRALGAAPHKSAVIAHAASEGISNVLTANLGIALAQRKGNKVLLIDADLCNPTLHRLFDIPNQQGLLEAALLQDKARTIFTTEVSLGLFLLVSGRLKQSAEPVLGLSAVGEILKKARADYDIVLIHCASLGLSRDVHYIAEQTNGVILVVDEQRTKRDTARARIETLKKKAFTTLGVILQDRQFVIPKFIYEKI